MKTNARHVPLLSLPIAIAWLASCATGNERTVNSDTLNAEAPDSGGSASDARTPPGEDAAPDPGPDAAQKPFDSGTACLVPGQLYCSGTCVDTVSNPMNCGACGRACLGQPCNQGVCEPTVLSTEFAALGGIAQDDTTIYFTGRDGALKSVPKAGGPTRTIATGLVAPMGVTVDGANAYVADRSAGKIVTIGLSSGATSDFATGQWSPQAVVSDDLNVYWSTYGSGAGNGTIAMCAKSACPTPTILFGTLQTPSSQQYGLATHMVVDAGVLYFAHLNNGGELHKHAPGGPDQVLLGSIGIVGSIALANNVITMVEWGNSTKISSTTTTGSAATTLATGQFFPVSAASTSTDVYWTHYNGGTQVVKCAITGCLASGPQVLARNIQPAEGILVDATYVYWASNDSRIYKTPR